MVTEIIDDQYLEKLDHQLGAFLSRERQMYATLVGRKMVDAEHLHDMTWRSLDAIMESMGTVEIFGLIAAIERVSRRYRLPEQGDDPFQYPFELGFGERMQDALTKWGTDDGTNGHVMVTGLMRQYAKDALWWLLDRELTVEKIWDRLREQDERKEAA